MIIRLIFIFFIGLSYIYGTFSYKYNTFPISIYRDFKPIIPSSDYSCPIANDRNATLKTFHQHGNFKDLGILLGDSLFQAMYDPRPYGLDGFVVLGQDGQTSRCLLGELDRFIEIEPNEIILYIGGNDLDKGILPKEVCYNIRKIADRIIEAEIPLTLHEIHYALSSARSPEYVLNTNSCINEISQNYPSKLNVISTLPEFKFESIDQFSDISTDGEHLNHKGYAIWISHIKKSLNNSREYGF